MKSMWHDNDLKFVQELQFRKQSVVLVLLQSYRGETSLAVSSKQMLD